jgi:hypothetical protein
MQVGHESETSVVAGGLGRIGIDSRNRFLLIGEFNFLRVDNPVADESFRAIGVLVAFSLGGTFKFGLVRCSVQVRAWEPTR